jgi:hypothetical protein
MICTSLQSHATALFIGDLSAIEVISSSVSSSRFYKTELQFARFSRQVEIVVFVSILNVDKRSSPTAVLKVRKVDKAPPARIERAVGSLYSPFLYMCTEFLRVNEIVIGKSGMNE